MITSHQYLKKYPIAANSKKLLVGTIHPHDHASFDIQFFYGNKASIWKILNEAFPGEMGKIISLTSILEFLEKRKISVSDTVIKCERKNPTTLDKDLIPIELNHDLIGQIRNSDIDEILFTSGFSKNNAFKLFYQDILKARITSEIRSDREVILDPTVFGRPVKLTILYSPSGSSNIGLSRSKSYLARKQEYITRSTRPVHDFKVDYYRNKFST